MRKKRSTVRRPQLGLALAALGTAAGAAGAVFVRKRRSSQPGEPPANQGGPQPDGRSAEPAGRRAGQSPQEAEQQTNHGDEGSTWSCECGQKFRVSGRDRHRLYWLPDAKPEDPVLDDQCPSCERQLSEQAS